MSQPVILRWARAIPLGFYRSLVLVGLTVMPVAVAAAVGFGGSLFTLGWPRACPTPRSRGGCS